MDSTGIIENQEAQFQVQSPSLMHETQSENEERFETRITT